MITNIITKSRNTSNTAYFALILQNRTCWETQPLFNILSYFITELGGGTVCPAWKVFMIKL